MGIVYTKDQLQVIQLRNRNILVSAAAGSGKTTVLVERIIRMISDESRPVDIDRLLIVTFTNAAAAQMREKIGNAINQQLKEQPDNVHLQKQATLLHNALITTIHSFCLFLIKNNFNDIGLDPGFRVADEGEIKLIRETVMKQLIEDRFQGKNPAFTRLAERFITGNSMRGLTQIIESLYHHAVSYPFPGDWLRDRLTDYQTADAEALEQMDWMLLLKKITKETIEECTRLCEKNLVLCEESDGPYMYADALQSDRELLSGFQSCSKYQDYVNRFEKLEFARLSSKKDTSVSTVKKEIAKASRDGVKAMLVDLKKKYFSVSLKGVLTGMEENAGIIRTLTDTVLEFTERFTVAKREKKLIDFDDMEHLALQILLVKEEEGYAPSKTALDYRSYFKEIMIDEYQDSNLVQEWILKTISGEAEGNYNRFMVGDVKQSIYKFRLACPELFMEKYDTYQRENSTTQRIDLSSNYRSRQEIVDTVNFFFEKIMAKDLGNVSYDENSALYCGASYPANPLGNETEILLVEKEGEASQEEQGSKTSKQQLEACAIAGKIKELAGNFEVTDEKTGTLRKAMYKDMVILLRTNSGWDEEFRKVFEQEGIPAYITSRTGYFAANEIRVLMNFLRVLDNPRQDIPLFGTMKSSFGQFSEEELAAIAVFEGDCFYQKVQSCGAYSGEKQQDTESTSVGEETKAQQTAALFRQNKLPVEKAGKFLAMIEKYREMVAYTPIHKLLRQLLLETDYLYQVSALAGGEQRAANVNMLLEKAESYEKSSYSGLFHFIRYMEQIQKYDVDYGEAGTLDENANVVRIMSIHKSKGLEFPICFVAGLSKKFNKNDLKETLICDTTYGIGMDYVDLANRVKYPDLRKKIIAEHVRLDNLGEELRVLYVALTRAKEKLILSGMVDSLPKLIEKFGELQAKMGVTKQSSAPHRKQTATLPYSMRAYAGSYLELLLPCLISAKSFQEIVRTYGEFEVPTDENAPTFLVECITADKLAVQKTEETLSAADLKQTLLQDIQEQKNAPQENPLKEQITFHYAHNNLSRLYTKTTVSELKIAAMNAAYTPEGQEEKARELFPTEQITPVIPRFAAREEKVSGSARGSAYHRVMELLDFADILKQTEKEAQKEAIKNQLTEFITTGQLTQEESDMVKLEKLLTFFQTDLAAHMAAAGLRDELHKEQPFVLGVPAARLSPEFPDSETVLIQGIIDVYYIEDNHIVLMDYKTDVVKTPEELIKRYETQLLYYQESLERILDMPVTEKLIYSFHFGKVIAL